MATKNIYIHKLSRDDWAKCAFFFSTIRQHSSWCTFASVDRHDNQRSLYIFCSNGQTGRRLVLAEMIQYGKMVFALLPSTSASISEYTITTQPTGSIALFQRCLLLCDKLKRSGLLYKRSVRFVCH
ncbi:hypothetical protein D917_01424 [Trichinella nativa]|uniref:Uncharacterized protein n=1 Tax=Trichinella nativa TaxID=6335 RepID=A0A1Y3EUH6_9BILA|nr:hypothetical protein D917_01424 [Trichinella nativa]